MFGVLSPRQQPQAAARNNEEYELEQTTDKALSLGPVICFFGGYVARTIARVMLQRNSLSDGRVVQCTRRRTGVQMVVSLLSACKRFHCPEELVLDLQAPGDFSRCLLSRDPSCPNVRLIQNKTVFGYGNLGDHPPSSGRVCVNPVHQGRVSSQRSPNPHCVAQ